MEFVRIFWSSVHSINPDDTAMIQKQFFPVFLFVIQIIFSTTVSADSNGVLPGLEAIPEKMCHLISSDNDQHQGEENKEDTEEEEEPDCD